MFRTLLIVALAALIAAPCLAADEKPKTNATSTAKKPPTASKPKYNPVLERAKFFKAAGKDSELDNKEFAVDQGKAGGFVRKTDSWGAISKYDKNSNKTIDWFEADAFRRSAAIKKPVIITTVDGQPVGGQGGARPDGRGGDQRGGDRGRGGWQPSAEALKAHDKDGDGKLNDAERGAYFQARRDEWRKQMTERYDTNKDGRVDDKERQAARADYMKRQLEERKKRHFERFDANKDGKLDVEEQAGLEKHNKEHEERDAREQADRERRRKEFMGIHDKDGDGEITEKEREGIREYYRKRSEERRAEAVKRFDKNGDGELNDEERAAMFREFRSRRGGGGRPGGQPGGGDGGRGPRPEGGGGGGPR